MKKKTLFNIKGAGRPAVHDKGIRHTEREKIKGNTALHLTIKVLKDKAGIRNKDVLKLLHSSIKKARLIGLRIVHYTLEYDHIHLLVEADSNGILAKGMQSFGISFSKGINKIKNVSGQVFKTRYHFRKLKTPTEIKNVINYIFGNSVKHKKEMSILSLYNSLPALKNFSKLYPGFELAIHDDILKSFALSKLKNDLENSLASVTHPLIKRFT